MLKIFENYNFLPTKSDKMMISILFSTVLNMRPYIFETIFSRVFWDMSLLLPLAPPKKFILCSGFDNKGQTNLTKSSFFGFGYLQI